MYVDDLANCINEVIQQDIREDLLNVGSGEEVSILQLSEIIKEVVGYEGFFLSIVQNLMEIQESFWIAS